MPIVQALTQFRHLHSIFPNHHLDFGASHHVANDLHNISGRLDYVGIDDIVIGNGEGLNITDVDSIHIFAKKSFLLII